jgi:hypothetical protein
MITIKAWHLPLSSRLARPWRIGTAAAMFYLVAVGA